MRRARLPERQQPAAPAHDVRVRDVLERHGEGVPQRAAGRLRAEGVPIQDLVRVRLLDVRRRLDVPTRDRGSCPVLAKGHAQHEAVAVEDVGEVPAHEGRRRRQEGLEGRRHGPPEVRVRGPVLLGERHEDFAARVQVREHAAVDARLELRAQGRDERRRAGLVGARAFVLKTWPSLGGTLATLPSRPAFSNGACASGVLLGNASSSFRRRAGLEDPSTPRMASATSHKARSPLPLKMTRGAKTAAREPLPR